MSEGRKINCATEIRCHLPVPPNGSGDGEIRVYCAGGDVDGSACLSLAITTPVADIVVTLDGAEARALRAQIDEEHRAEHRHAGHALRMPGEANPVVACECGCGETFERYDATNRPRRFVSGHNPHPATRRDAVLRVLERGPMHCAAIVEALGGQRHAVATALSRLKLCGVVANDTRGVWRKVSSDG